MVGKIITILAAGLALSGGTASASNYYVNAKTGTTGAEGTKAHPYLHIQEAMRKVPSAPYGNFITIYPGTYNETVEVNNETRPQYIEGYDGKPNEVNVTGFKVTASAKVTLSWLESCISASATTETADDTSDCAWKPSEALTYYWQLQGAVNNSEAVDAYFIDGFETEASEVTTLHSKGIKAVCYIDVGTWEEWRSDAGSFPKVVLGNGNGWPGEKYLNIADTSAIEPLMQKRFEMCKSKGFDAAEPDNIEDYAESHTGFTLTAAEQLTYNEWIANEVHALGMAVFQKNDGEQTSTLHAYFDGVMSEECNRYSECGSFASYTKEGKPVLNTEYSGTAVSGFCAKDEAAGIEGALFDLELDGKLFEPCWTK
jgi:Glycoside-hydrolase family GH114